MSATQTIELEAITNPQVPIASQHGTLQTSTSPYPAPASGPTSPPQRIFEQAQDSFHTLSTTRKITILVLIVGCNFVQMISNIVGLAAGLEISKVLGVQTGPGQANWIAASYPLTQGTFVLISGRLGSVYGHKNILLIGGAWFVLWTVINGFMNNFTGFVVVRALSGVGGALIMPNVVALIAVTCPPGRMRNLSLGFFSASAPTGGWLGSLICGGFVKSGGGDEWRWLFYTM
jgi:MFS family permease